VHLVRHDDRFDGRRVRAVLIPRDAGRVGQAGSSSSETRYCP
jgi:hypothetical protein